MTLSASEFSCELLRRACLAKAPISDSILAWRRQRGGLYQPNPPAVSKYYCRESPAEKKYAHTGPGARDGTAIIPATGLGTYNEISFVAGGDFLRCAAVRAGEHSRVRSLWDLRLLHPAVQIGAEI